MTTHDVKCWPQFFQRIVDGEKTFEIRPTHDREFKEGDCLRLKEWNPRTQMYTGRKHICWITYVFPGKVLFQLEDGGELIEGVVFSVRSN